MKYSTPGLVVLGSAAILVLGGVFGQGDSSDPTMENIPVGIAPGLDD